RLVSDWSSDVCSSDLEAEQGGQASWLRESPLTGRHLFVVILHELGLLGPTLDFHRIPEEERLQIADGTSRKVSRASGTHASSEEIGRASCRERGEETE